MQQYRPAVAATEAAPPPIIDRNAAAKLRRSTQAEKFAERLARLIERRTNRAIRQLRVEISPQGIALEGHCSAFYLKQLAQEAVLATIEDQPLSNRIVVK